MKCLAQGHVIWLYSAAFPPSDEQLILLILDISQCKCAAFLLKLFIMDGLNAINNWQILDIVLSCKISLKAWNASFF